MTEETITETPIELPDGDYAIVECMGHQTLIGRYSEIEQFGTKMMAIEPIFQGQLLPVTYRGGASIYAFTPCTKEVALKRAPTRKYELPPGVLAAVPLEMLPAPEPEPAFSFADEPDAFDEEPF